jgi:elongation factor P hydroxylase
MQNKAVFSQNAVMKLTTPSLEFFKPTLATTLAIVLAWLVSVRPAQAGYTVTLQQVGPNVVATGSGPLDLTGLLFTLSRCCENPAIHPSGNTNGGVIIRTGPTSSSVDIYRGPERLVSIGSGSGTAASSGSGDMVGVATLVFGNRFNILSVPTGYVSGNPLSDSATYNNATLATLGVTPGTYVWTWGTGANQNFTIKILTPGPGTATVPDFNGDGHPDYLLYSGATRRTVVWYMNNNVHFASGNGPILPSGWSLVNVADFNGDGHPDYLLYNPVTRATVIWYLVGATFLGANHGPQLVSGWEVAGTGDFNGDGGPDLVLYRASTHETVIWYLENNVRVASARGPTIQDGWSVVAVADFNGDSNPDYLLYRPSEPSVIWVLSGVTHASTRLGPFIPAPRWALVGVADFDGDGSPDYVLYNAGTRQTAIWYLDENFFLLHRAAGPTLPSGWALVAP